jgi:hypothetical protein
MIALACVVGVAGAWLACAGLSILLQRHTLGVYDELPRAIQTQYRRPSKWSVGGHVLGGPFALAYWGFMLLGLDQAEEEERGEGGSGVQEDT